MRTFIGIEIPERIKERIKEFNEFDNMFKRTVDENLHITLSFLGEVENVNEIYKQLKGIKSNVCVNLKGVNVFIPEFIRIIYINVDGLEPLLDEIRKKGFKTTDPHLTIYRVNFKPKDKKQILETIQKYKNTEFGKFCPKTINIYESILEKPHARYKILYKVDIV